MHWPIACSWLVLSYRLLLNGYKLFVCQQLVPCKVLNQFLLMRSNIQPHTQRLTWGEEIELVGRNAAPCVCNRSRLQIEGHCKSEWLERQRPLGKAVLITRYDYSKGNVCVGVWWWVLCGSLGWLIPWGMCVCILMIANKWAWAIFSVKCK